MAEKQTETALIEARAKLAEKFGDQARLGGKGSQRRKKKAVHKTQITDDKKLKPIIKKFGVQPLPGIDEVNMFKDDNTVLNFKHPEGFLSLFSSVNLRLWSFYTINSHGFITNQHLRCDGKTWNQT